MTERVVLPQDVVPVHYAIEITPNFNQLDFHGSEEVEVNVTKGGIKEVTLHAKEIYIEKASFKSASGVSIGAEQINFHLKDDTVHFVFDDVLPEGKGSILIEFRGILNGDMAGFYRSYYTDVNGVKKVMASTQFEALDARRAFPCWDEPAVKCTFAVSLVVPAELTALSNMPEQSCSLLSSAEKKSMLKKVVFDTTPKMSTYLLAWAVGEFDHVSGVTKGGVAIRVFSPPGRALQGTFALDCGIRALDFYDDFFQVPYPLPKLDMIAITEFAAGAMENWGLVTYRETALLADVATASPQSLQRVAIVVAHELAHQWFGNLVTMAWWDGLWLNEGFAAFMEHYCVDALYPDYKIWDQYTTDAFGSAQRLDSLRSSHPIIVPIGRAEEVEQVFDAISYCKGSTVVRMVQALVGEDNFRKGLQIYMKRHALGNTETPQLWGAWSEASGLNVAQLMHTWTTSMGYPFLTVVEEQWDETEVLVTLEQTRFLSDGSVDAEEGQQGSATGVLWEIPLLFATSHSVSKQAVVMREKRQTFSVPVAGSAGVKPWLKINAGQKALVRVAHSPEMISRLQGAVSAGLVGAVDRAALVLDAYALAKAGKAPLEAVVEILKVMKDEDSSVAWGAIAGVLSALFVLLEQLPGAEKAFEAFKVFGKQMVVSGFSKVGWDSKPDDSHTDKLLRAKLIGLLDTFAWSDEGVAAEAKKRFDAHWEDPSALPAEYKSTVYRIVLMNGGKTEYDQILKEYQGTEDSQEQKYAMASLGSARDPALKLKTLDWAVNSGEVRLQDVFYPMGSVSGSLEGCNITWTFFQQNFELLKDKLAKASPSLMAAVVVNSVSHFSTASRADEIEQFFKTHPLPSCERRISQTLENMRASAQLLERMKTSQLVKVEYWKLK